MKYLTQEGKKALEEQRKRIAEELARIAQDVLPGNFQYRGLKRYMDGLDYLLDLEEYRKS